MEIKKIFTSKSFKGATCGVLAFIMLLLVFKVGLMAGERKGGFSKEWSDNYHRNFAGPRGGFGNDFVAQDFMNGNGIMGQIIKIASSTLIIKGPDNMEKSIAVDGQTAIKRFKDNVKFNDLRVDEYAVVIGEPNQIGQIAAKFIRLIPPPPAPRPF